MIITIIRFLFIPFSLLFGFIMEVRNGLYRIGICKSMKFPTPIISIGNITLGGTGKTPFTILLAELLKNDFQKIAIISRGYGRKSSGMQLVSDGKNILLDPYKAGDEPFLIALRRPDVLVAVSEKRRIAIDYLIKKYQPELIILDDAFQHRNVQRDVDIVLLNTEETWQSRFILPTGNLREFKHNLKRADILVFANSENPSTRPLSKYKKYTDNIFSSKSVLKHLVDSHMQNIGTLDSLKNKPVFALAGIAHPNAFKNALKSIGILLIVFQAYPDHYTYSNADMDKIIDYCIKEDCSVILCTEKDLVKIARLDHINVQLQKAGIELLGVQLKLEIESVDLLVKNIQTILDNNK